MGFFFSSSFPCLVFLTNRKEVYTLKDWHFARDIKGWEAPALFDDDWLNLWWQRHRGDRDDFRFVYAGPRGTMAPMHHDVLCSYSWSANLAGRKRWLLVPPSETPKLLDR